MATVPTLSRATSYSDVEPKDAVDDKRDEEKMSDTQSITNVPNVPIWRRILLGNATNEKQTQRAMHSRHLMMIGAGDSAPREYYAHMFLLVLAIGGTIGTGIFLSAGSVRPQTALTPVDWC